jgi:hypothetical protein
MTSAPSASLAIASQQAKDQAGMPAERSGVAGLGLVVLGAIGSRAVLGNGQDQDQG